jgi:hypothetical protein
MGKLNAFESPGWNVCQVSVWVVFRSAVAVNAAGPEQIGSKRGHALAEIDTR